MVKFVRSFIVISFMTFCVLPPASADEVAELKEMIQQLRSDYETRIDMLEKKIDRLTSDQQKTTAQLEQKIDMQVASVQKNVDDKMLNVDYVGRGNAPVGSGGLVVDNPFGFGNVSVGGYVDMEYHDFEDTESTFRQHRWIINIGAQPHEQIRFNSELEIEYGGPDTAASDGEVKVEQAYVDFLMEDWVNLRAGAVLAPFGRYNLYHDSDLQDLTDRPLLARDIVPTTWTEAGYGFFGEFDPIIGDYEDLLINYELYAVNGLDAGFSDTGLRGARNSLKTDNNDNKAIVGRVGFSPFIGQEIGVSGYYGEYDNEDFISGVALDSFWTMGPLELVTEYARFDVQEDTPTSARDLPNFLQGAYVQLNYHFWPEFLDDTVLGRKFDHPTFTLVGRYDWAEIDDDGNDADFGNNEETRYTIGLNYRPIDNFVVKFEYQFNQTDNETLEHGDSNGFLTSVALGF